MSFYSHLLLGKRKTVLYKLNVDRYNRICKEKPGQVLIGVATLDKEK